MAKRILVVDDEEKLAANLKVFLELNGYEVFCGHDGEQGLAEARAHKPDLIISDVMMPKMDGYTMLKELKMDQSLAGIPVVMLTAKDGLSDLCEIEGSAQFLVKPFDLSMLLDVVQKHVQ
jgi:DNA-binding response OmpR family regulator